MVTSNKSRENTLGKFLPGNSFLGNSLLGPMGRPLLPQPPNLI